MVFVVYSDVHSNLEALNVFFEALNDIPYGRLVCLGDIVGYGADPNPVVELIREKTNIVLGGNHDFAAIGKTDPSNFNPYAFNSCMWTRSELLQENQRYLQGLSSKKVIDGITWVHSSPLEPEKWHYVLPYSFNEKNFEHFNTKICFVGHSHVPVLLEKTPQAEIKTLFKTEYFLRRDCRYIVNVGSVGQPRDGCQNPAFVVYDSEKDKVKFYRFSYDFTLTQQKILRAGLPPYLAKRLAEGR